MSAIISADELYRYRLDRQVGLTGRVFAYFGINPSTASALEEDATTRRWRGFTMRNDGRAYIAGNPFAYRTPDVNKLTTIADPIGPENAQYLREIIAEADILVPCWGRRGKVPAPLHGRIDALIAQLFAARKPVRIFGLTQSGDPLHPLMLSNATPLVDWNP